MMGDLQKGPRGTKEYSFTAAVWWPWVKNYYGELCVGSHRSAPNIARIWIDQELKKKMGY